MTAWLLVLLACTDKGEEPTEPVETAHTGTSTTPTDTGTPAPTELHDPLTMPLEPTLDPSDADAAAACVACHADYVDQWSTSMHSYAMVDPVYKALVAVRQRDLNGQEDRFCLSCHTTIGSRGGEIFPGFSFDDLSPIAQEGITCVSCHKVSEVVRLNNAGHVLDLDGPMRGPIVDFVPSAFHDTEPTELFAQSELCGSCHDVIETSGLNLERPYEEFLESPAYPAGGTCQDCHMPSSRGPIVQGGPDRDRHDHRFIGVDVPLMPGFLTPEQEEKKRDEVEALLRGSATLDMHVANQPAQPGDQLDLVIDVRNRIDAHNFPTGSTFIRQAWLEIVATDAEGRVLYETGTLDANGDLRNQWSELDRYGDNDLIIFSSNLVDRNGNPEIFTWKAAELFPYSIPPLHDRVYTLFIPTQQAVSPITIAGRIRFRSHGPYLLRALGLDELIPRLSAVDIDALTIEIPLVEAPEE